MRTLVVSNDVMDPLSSKLRGLLRAGVDGQGPSAATFADAEHMLTQAQAELVIIVLSPEPELALAAMRQLRRGPARFLLAVGEITDPKLILRALQHGADHYLDQADDDEFGLGL